MSNSPNLSLSLPRCRNCGRYWHPAQGVISDMAYCKKCKNERQAAAALRLDLKRVTSTDLTGSYLLPRKFRPS